MAATCYLCEARIARKPIGTPDNMPYGVCGICGVLACQGHGIREPNRPRFECVICISIVAAVSAGAQARGPSPLAVRLTALLTSIGGEAWLVRTVEEFLLRYPEFEAWLNRLPEMEERAQRGFRTADTEPFYSSLDERARDLLLLAMIIVVACEIPSELLPEPLRQLAQSFR